MHVRFLRITGNLGKDLLFFHYLSSFMQSWVYNQSLVKKRRVKNKNLFVAVFEVVRTDYFKAARSRKRKSLPG